MRTFGIILAIVGAVMGLTFFPFGWLLLIIGLLLMIAGGREAKPARPSGQSTGGYAGLRKSPPLSGKHLGDE